jgi:proton-dependent oligopeptide transporter, POT family
MALLCLIGALEKFSYNGLRALLVLYLTSELLFADGQAFAVYGAIVSLGFVTPILGGWISDSFLGNRKSLFLGALWTALGCFALMIPWRPAFFLGLGFLVLGSGFIRSNVPALLGKLPAPGQRSRDAAFTLLYTSYNVGTFLGTLACAVIGEVLGWHWGFLAAAVAMLVCVVLVLSGGARLEPPSQHAGTVSVARPPGGIPRAHLIALLCAGLGTLLGTLIQEPRVLDYLIPVCTLLAILLMLYLGATTGRAGLFSAVSIFVLMIFHTAFFALYEQAGLSLTLFTQRNVDRSIQAWLGIEQMNVLGAVIKEVPVTFFQLIDPVLNITLGSLIAVLWIRLEKSGIRVKVPLNFALGLLMIALGFALLATSLRDNAGGLVSPWWLVGTYCLFVVGELCTIPVGLSMISRLAPRQYITVFMGIWFVSIGSSAWMASTLSKLTAGAGAAGLHAAQSLQIYRDVFQQFALGAFALAFLLVVLNASFFKLLIRRYALQL